MGSPPSGPAWSAQSTPARCTPWHVSVSPRGGMGPHPSAPDGHPTPAHPLRPAHPCVPAVRCTQAHAPYATAQRPPHERELLSRVRLFPTPWTVARQAPLSNGFSRQEYWSGLPCPPPGDRPDPGIQPGSPALSAESSPSEPPGKPARLLVPQDTPEHTTVPCVPQCRLHPSTPHCTWQPSTPRAPQHTALHLCIPHCTPVYPTRPEPSPLCRCCLGPGQWSSRGPLGGAGQMPSL